LDYELKRQYNDLASVGSAPVGMAAVLKLWPITWFTYGSDVPFGSTVSFAEGIARLGLTDHDLKLIQRGNAERLFPRFAQLLVIGLRDYNAASIYGDVPIRRRSKIRYEAEIATALLAVILICVSPSNGTARSMENRHFYSVDGTRFRNGRVRNKCSRIADRKCVC
jgi:hypothetical protein